MPKVTVDLVSQSSVSFDKDGYHQQRRYKVTGIDTSQPPELIEFQALTAVDSASGKRVPTYGTPHESIQFLFCQTGIAKPLGDGNKSFLIDTSWGWNVLTGTSTQARITSSVALIQANNDGKGNFFVVGYKDSDGVTHQNYVKLPVVTKHAVLDFTRIENKSPLAKTLTHESTINLDSFQSFPQYSWICNVLGGEQIAGNQWRVNYQFEYHPEGFVQLGFYEDPVTHVIPKDILGPAPVNAIPNTAAGGQISNGVYGRRPVAVNFAALNIPNFYAT